MRPTRSSASRTPRSRTSRDDLLLALLERIAEILDRHGGVPAARERRAPRARGEGHRGGGRAGRPHPRRPRLRRTRRRRTPPDHHPRRRPRRHPQPDPAREGHPLPPRRPAPRRGPRHRRPARRHAHPPRLHRRRPRAAPGRGRPRRARHRARPALRTRARARAAAERAVRVVEAVQRVTDAALAYLSDGGPPRRAARPHARDPPRRHRRDPHARAERRVLRARAAKGIEEEVEQGVRIPVGRGFAGRIAAERRADRRSPTSTTPTSSTRSCARRASAPCSASRCSSRAASSASSTSARLTPRDFTDDDRDLLQLAADRAALAIDQAELYEQRRVAEALQRRLLPQQLAAVPGIEVAGRYLPAARREPGRRLVRRLPARRRAHRHRVGDVVGHGLPAAALMAQLRTALRAYAFDGQRPARSSTASTGCCLPRPGDDDHRGLPGRSTPSARRSSSSARATRRRSSIAPDGDGASCRCTAGSRSAPRAARATASRRSASRPGRRSCSTPTALVEVRGESIDDGPRAAAPPRRARARDVEALCDDDHRGHGRPTAPGRRRRDARRAPRPAAPITSRTRWPADARRRSRACATCCAAGCASHGATDDEIYDITVACQEACANAVEHAYAPGPAGVRGRGRTHDDGAIEIAVRDRGQWRPARGTQPRARNADDARR